MSHILTLVAEDKAEGKVAEVYQRIREGFQIDFVPNFFKAQATKPDLLETTWNSVEGILLRESYVPRTVKEMMFTAISKANRCNYCEAAHLAFCKVLGVDKDTRDQVLNDIDAIRPERMRDIIKFGIKAGSLPMSLSDEDYASLRSHGVSDAELQEIVAMASFASYANIIADALRVPIDEDFSHILA